MAEGEGGEDQPGEFAGDAEPQEEGEPQELDVVSQTLFTSAEAMANAMAVDDSPANAESYDEAQGQQSEARQEPAGSPVREPPPRRQPGSARPSTGSSVPHSIRLTTSRRQPFHAIFRPSKPCHTSRVNHRLTKSAGCGTGSPVDEALKRKALGLRRLGDLDDGTYEDLGGELKSDKGQTADLGELDRYGKAIGHVQVEQRGAEKARYQREKRSEVDEDIESAERDLQEFDAETERLGNVLNEKHDAQREELRNKQAEEHEKFIEVWRSEPQMRRFSHVSPVLGNMRRQFQLMTKRGDYDSAAALRKQIDDKIAFETKEAAQNYKWRFDEARRAEALQFEAQKKGLEAELATERSGLATQRQLEREPYEKVLAKLQVRKQLYEEPEKPWARARTMREDEIRTGAVKETPPKEPSAPPLQERNLVPEILESMLITLPPSVLAVE